MRTTSKARHKCTCTHQSSTKLLIGRNFSLICIFFILHVFKITFLPTIDDRIETDNYDPVVNTIYTWFVGK